MKRYDLLTGCLVLTLTLCVPACTVGPNYRQPSVATPDHFKEAKGKTVMSDNQMKGFRPANPLDDKQRGEWWKVFHDRTLNALEARLDVSNQSLKNAYATYMQARAIVEEARAGFLPTLTATLGFTRQKRGTSSVFTSGNTINNWNNSFTGSFSSSSSGASIQDNYTWLLNASWEPDIWGSVQRTVEADVANAEASGALVAATRLSAEASLAQYYFELRGLDADQVFLDTTVENYKALLKYTRNRYAVGVDSSADVAEAQSQLENAQVLAVNNGIQRAQYEHAIAVLTGVPPAEFSLKAVPKVPVPPAIPLAVPSALLERRPDIAEAERQMRAANAQIGVAVAAWFPALTLSGNGNTVTQRLLQVPALNWGLGAQLAETLVDGGLRAATVHAAEAGYRASVANWQETVLSAFQDVEDNLASLRILASQSVFQGKAVDSALRALQIAVNQYNAGTVDWSSVLNAEITATSARKSASDLNALRMTSAVGLIKALGGGWSAQIIPEGKNFAEEGAA